MQTCVGQNCGHAYNSMELFHAIDFLTCQPSITWNSFQAITHHTNLPCYYHLYISRLLQGCIFHALSWRRSIVPRSGRVLFQSTPPRRLLAWPLSHKKIPTRGDAGDADTWTDGWSTGMLNLGGLNSKHSPSQWKCDHSTIPSPKLTLDAETGKKSQDYPVKKS